MGKVFKVKIHECATQINEYRGQGKMKSGMKVLEISETVLPRKKNKSSLSITT